MSYLSSDPMLMASIEPDIQDDDEPEIWEVIRRNRQFGVQYFQGAWSDWPYIFILEYEAALRAEIEISERMKEAIPPVNNGE